MEINWSEAPEWANYAAMDEGGEWWWYEEKPYIRNIEWLARNGKHEPMNFWRTTLQGRPNA